ncbi:MAG: hypothetical protein ACE5ES_04585 [Candidatus Nanoarchaeia archaeon]
MKIRINKSKIYGTMSLILIAVLVIMIIPNPITHNMAMDEKRNEFISLKQEIRGEMLSNGKYRCCLEKPCVYCIEKTPGHGEGAECSCLEDVVNGVHPCGECIGEILEGHGNPYLAEYFAKAIAEKTGEEEAIKKIIEEKYGISVEEQV